MRGWGQRSVRGQRRRRCELTLENVVEVEVELLGVDLPGGKDTGCRVCASAYDLVRVPVAMEELRDGVKRGCSLGNSLISKHVSK